MLPGNHPESFNLRFFFLFAARAGSWRRWPPTLQEDLWLSMFVSSKIFALPSVNKLQTGFLSPWSTRRAANFRHHCFRSIPGLCILHKMMEASVCHVFSSLHRKETSDNSSPVPSKIGLKQPVHVSQDVMTSLALLPQ